MKIPFILWMNIFQSQKVKDKYTFVVFSLLPNYQLVL